MAGAFEEREDAFEKRFALDETQRFRALARRNKTLGLWAARLIGLSAAEGEAYAARLVGTQVGADEDAVFAALRDDLAKAKADVSDHRLRRRMEQELAAALAAIKRGD